MKILLVNEFSGEITGYLDLARGELRAAGPVWSTQLSPKPLRNITLLEYIGIDEFHVEQEEDEE